MTLWEYYRRKLAREKEPGWGEFPSYGDTGKPSFQGPPERISDYGNLLQDYDPTRRPRYTTDYAEPAIDDKTLYLLMQTYGKNREYEEI